MWFVEKNIHAMTLVDPYVVCEKNTHAMTLVDPYVECAKNIHAMTLAVVNEKNTHEMTLVDPCGFGKEHTCNLRWCLRKEDTCNDTSVSMWFVKRTDM